MPEPAASETAVRWNPLSALAQLHRRARQRLPILIQDPSVDGPKLRTVRQKGGDRHEADERQDHARREASKSHAHLLRCWLKNSQGFSKPTRIKCKKLARFRKAVMTENKCDIRIARLERCSRIPFSEYEIHSTGYRTRLPIHIGRSRCVARGDPAPPASRASRVADGFESLRGEVRSGRSRTGRVHRLEHSVHLLDQIERIDRIEDGQPRVRIRVFGKETDLLVKARSASVFSGQARERVSTQKLRVLDPHPSGRVELSQRSIDQRQRLRRLVAAEEKVSRAEPPSFASTVGVPRMLSARLSASSRLPRESATRARICAESAGASWRATSALALAWSSSPRARLTRAKGSAASVAIEGEGLPMAACEPIPRLPQPARLLECQRELVLHVEKIRVLREESLKNLDGASAIPFRGQTKAMLDLRELRQLITGVWEGRAGGRWRRHREVTEGG